MTYEEAEQQVLKGKEATRSGWENKQKIRMGQLSDFDYINYDNLTSVIVSECAERKCDCIICLYNPTPADQQAQDWEIL